MGLSVQELEIKESAEKVRNYLRDGICHSHRDEIDALAKRLLDYGEFHHRIGQLPEDQLYVLVRAVIMCHSALDSLDGVTKPLSQMLINLGKIIEKGIAKEVAMFIKLDTQVIPAQTNLLKQKFALILAYASEVYRTENPTAAREICRNIYNLIVKLRPKNRQMEGLFSRACIQLAKTYRSTMNYIKARQYYDEALEATYRQTDIRMKELMHRPDLQNEEFRYYRRRVVMTTAAGIGYISIATGQMNQAAIILWPLRTLMLQDQDIISKEYLKMLTASVQRARAGYDREILEAARRDLQSSFDFFRSIGHIRYMRPTLHELVLCLIYLKNFPDAARYTDFLRNINRQEFMQRRIQNSRWDIVAYILDGIRYKHEGKYDEVIQYVQKANNISSGTQNRRSKIEINILWGEALYYSENKRGQSRYELAAKRFKEAIEDFEKKEVEQVVPDVHLMAVANIYLALIELKNNDPEAAQEYFKKATKEPIEHKWVDSLVDLYKEESAKSLGKLIIHDFKKPYRELEIELQNSLIYLHGQSNDWNAVKIGKILGLDRRVVSPWIKRVRKKTKINSRP
jgi:tetratricopeptide (TPR) repeat protein